MLNKCIISKNSINNQKKKDFSSFLFGKTTRAPAGSAQWQQQRQNRPHESIVDKHWEPSVRNNNEYQQYPSLYFVDETERNNKRLKTPAKQSLAEKITANNKANTLFCNKEYNNKKFTKSSQVKEKTTSPEIANKSLCEKRNLCGEHLHEEPPLILINGKVWDGYLDDDIYQFEQLFFRKIVEASERENYIERLIAETEQLLEQSLHGKCMAGGKGLREGYVGIECVFYVETLCTAEDYTQQRGKVEVEIIGPNQRPIRIKSFALDRNLYQISYVPCSSGYHMISVTWDGRHVIGSPFCAKILF